jgi:hypothetical protein
MKYLSVDKIKNFAMDIFFPKFCFSCQKTVVDFTQKTDTEIATILLQNQDKVCGRFYQSQLKTIYLPKPQIRTSHFRTGGHRPGCPCWPATTSFH